jgi:2-oxoglutarate ferredoxin oxidoreductase subunit delta
MANKPTKEKSIGKTDRVKEIIINDAWCKGCEICVDVCPQLGVLAVSDEVNAKGYRRIVIANLSLCTGCGLCELMCPDIAITIRKA